MLDGNPEIRKKNLFIIKIIKLKVNATRAMKTDQCLSMTMA